MYKFNLNEIKEATKGKILNQVDNKDITYISIDSRDIKPNTLFIPIIGETHDGHKFLESAYENGCRTFLIDKNHKFIKNDINLIEVKDTTKAFGYIAKYFKEKFDIKSIGITGSVGKTSTRDMVYSVVKEKNCTLKNEGNFNNEIGIPKTLLNLNKKYRYEVLEMGMSYKNEIKHLANLINPDIAIISNIGMSHIEHFKNQKGIFDAKMEITTNFNKNSILIINGDDPFLKTLKNKKHKYKVLSYGFEKDNDIYCKEYIIKDEYIDFITIYDNQREIYRIPTIAKHNILNAMSAILVGHILNMKEKEIQKGLRNFELTKMRLDIFTNDKYRIINDTYNASSTSMISALEVLSNFKERKVAILGDIFETGKYDEEIHRQVGKHIKNNTDILITIGNSSKYINDEAINNDFNKDNSYHFNTKEDFLKEKENIIKDNDTILLKASRGMTLETLIESLK